MSAYLWSLTVWDGFFSNLNGLTFELFPYTIPIISVVIAINVLWAVSVLIVGTFRIFIEGFNPNRHPDTDANTLISMLNKIETKEAKIHMIDSVLKQMMDNPEIMEKKLRSSPSLRNHIKKISLSFLG